MRTPVLIDTPYPTLLQTAKTMGVSAKRAREIAAMVDRIHDRNVAKRRKARQKARQSKKG